LRFFSPPENPSLTLEERRVHVEQLHLVADQIVELERIELVAPARRLHRVVRQAQELAVVHARHLDRVLEAEKQPGARALLRCHREQVDVAEQHLPGGHLVVRMPGQHFGERALARAVRPHDRVHLAGAHRQVDAAQDLGTVDVGVQVADLQQHFRAFANHPTLPSSFRPSSCDASTANSIGSCVNTSLTNPLMIIDTAASGSIPRLAR
jgi:hypothetical protein